MSEVKNIRRLGFGHAKPIAALRSALFHISFFGISIPLLALITLLSYLSPRLFTAGVKAWVWLHYVLSRLILGIKVELIGEMPNGPVFFALKHESMYETIDLPRIFHMPAIFVKEELLDIPLWGPLGAKYGLIAVRRSAGAGAMRDMLTAAKKLGQEKRAVAIFPEGTRIKPGETAELKAGFAGLYKAFRLPIVPVSVASGHVYPSGWIKYPGTVTYKIGESIPPGLSREMMEPAVIKAINALN